MHAIRHQQSAHTCCMQGGHGHRQVLAVFSGCVPLCIGDYVLQPFEPELDWTRFSLSLPQVILLMCELALPLAPALLLHSCVILSAGRTRSCVHLPAAMCCWPLPCRWRTRTFIQHRLSFHLWHDLWHLLLFYTLCTINDVYRSLHATAPICSLSSLIQFIEYSLLLPLQSRIPTLHEVLEGVNSTALAAMQAHLHCAAQHLAWSTLTGAFVHVRPHGLRIII